jgi:hypothetical protein
MNSEELQPVGWLSEVVLEGSDQPVRVVLDGREGNRVFVRQQIPRMATTRPEFRSLQAMSLSSCRR